MFSLANKTGISCLLTSVEISSHPLSILKIERIVLQILNRRYPIVAPSPTPWIIFAINEMFFNGTLELMEVELALKYNIGLGSGGLPLDVYRRPVVADVPLWEVDEGSFTVSDSSDVEILPFRERTIIDLTTGYQGEDVPQQPQRKRKLKRLTRAEKRQRREEQAMSTDDEDQQPEYWIDLMMETDDNENIDNGIIEEPDSKPTSPVPDYWILSDSSDPPLTTLRVGIFCPRPYRARLLNAIMTAMDNLPIEAPHPQFKRNGFYLDTLWFLGANDYSSSWMISAVEKLSKQKIWRKARILVEPWSSKFVVRNVLQLVLPWKRYPGNRKANVIQRLRKANLAHGSNRWNLIGCKLAKLKIQVTLAVNEETMESLKRTQFYVFYGFSQYRCEVIKTALK